MSTRETPRVLAARLGFKPLASQPGSYFRTLPSFFDAKPVGLILTIHRGRQIGVYQYSLVTDGGATTVRGAGDYFDIDRSLFVAMVLHEKHELSKEAT